MKRGFFKVLIVGGSAAMLFAQPEDVRRASMRGGGNGDSGKCTIEVVVDGVAEIAIAGDTGRMRTLSGTPSQWRRFECSGPLPPRVEDFRFSGVDGRGRQSLLRDPRQSNGTAVVRIEDPQGGREGYTFDIEWRGSGGFGAGGGVIGGGRDRDDRDRGDRGGRFDTARAIQFCQDAVRAKADRDFGYRDIDVRNANWDAGRGREWITGTFEGRRGPVRETMAFSCSIDMGTGRLRDVNIIRQGGPDGGGGGRDRIAGAIRACQDAVNDRLGRDGYRDVNIRSADVDNRRDGFIAGTLVARDRYGNANFDFSCSVDRGGRVGDVEVRRR